MRHDKKDRIEKYNSYNMKRTLYFFIFSCCGLFRCICCVIWP